MGVVWVLMRVLLWVVYVGHIDVCMPATRDGVLATRDPLAPKVGESEAWLVNLMITGNLNYPVDISGERNLWPFPSISVKSPMEELAMR